MAYTTIDKPTDYFNTVNYTGTGSIQTISGVGHQPDWIWTKGKSAFYEHNLRDSVRGMTKKLRSNSNVAEITTSDGITSTNSDGFVLGADTAGTDANEVNQSGQNYVAWNWKAGGSASSNSNGSITSSVSASTDAGFSIVTWTGTGSNATVGHGLGVAPSMIIVKSRSGAVNWQVYHSSIANTEALELNGTGPKFTAANRWNSTSTTSSVFSIGTSTETNASSATFVAYCFAEKKGYSKFGSYTGNGSSSGTYVHLGFKPAWLLVKDTGGSGEGWELLDSTRSSFNVADKRLRADNINAEGTGSNYYVDFLSNGFKQRNTQTSSNGNGSVYIYMAFAKNPFVTSTGVPATAR